MKLYIEQLFGLKLFHSKDVLALVRNENTAKDLLFNYKKQNLICLIRRDLYAVTDLVTKHCIATKFEIGSNITATSYISYHTALEYHGIAHQQFYILYVSSQQKFNEFEFDGINYLYCSSKTALGIYSPHLNGLIKVTDIERTVVDCIDRIDRGGGLEELIQSFVLINYLDEEKIERYLSAYNKAFLYQKVGFILSYFQQEMKLSALFFSSCKEKIGKSTRYLTTPEESPVYFQEWKLCAPKNILSFIEQGGDDIV